MEEFSVLLDDSSLHEVGIGRMFEKENGVHVSLDDLGKECDLVERDNRLRSLFEEALKTFLSERSVMGFRPIPASCSDGKHVDLFKLFWVVRKIGGYDMVCSKYLWGFVVEHCGMASGVTAFLKLIYVKYLKEFDQWLGDFNETSNLETQSATSSKLDSLAQELKAKLLKLMRIGIKNNFEGGVLQSIYEENSKDAGLNNGGSVADLLGSKEGDSGDKYDDAKFPSEGKKGSLTSRKRGLDEVINEVSANANGEKASALEDSDFPVPTKMVCRDIVEVQNNSEDDTNGRRALDNDNNMVLAVLEQGTDSQKLKRESLSFTTLLDWTRDVAKRSDDPGVGKIPNCCNFPNHAWLLALAVRKARFLNKISRSSNNAGQQQRMPWRDVPTTSRQKGISHTICKECIGAGVQITYCQHTESRNKGKESGPESTARNRGKARTGKRVSENKDGIEYRLSEKSRTHDIMIGPEYQAVVPEWTGKTYESDSKWLGTRICYPEEEVEDERKSPLSLVPEWTGKIYESDSKWLGTRIYYPEEEEEEKRKSSLSLVPVGRGRQESPCDCPVKNSIECMRFHVAEKRFMLKKELGPLFFKWRFDQMGEEVSLSWKPEEEDTFKKVVISSSATNLWEQMAIAFPSKTREMLLSYFFNVYINQLRSYQNRSREKDIDSDSEEQCEAIGERFGYLALEPPKVCKQLCIENKQSFEFQ